METISYVNELNRMLTQSDNLIIPKEIMDADIYDETKIMFGSLFAEAIQRENGKCDSSAINNMKSQMKVRINSMSKYEIQAECCCSESKVSIIRKEVLELIDTVNFKKCFKE